jgi:hypothetical protein
VPVIRLLGEVDGPPTMAVEMARDQAPERGVVRKRFDQPMMAGR